MKPRDSIIAMQADDAQLFALATELGGALTAHGLKLVCAESCTGGWIAKAITDVPGSSGWFERGFVTYSNAAKTAMLGVQAASLKQYGAVSETVVREMAEGAARLSGVQVTVAVSGIAGPEGGSPDKPVGTVWIAWRWAPGKLDTRCFHFTGDREAVRLQAVRAALEGLRDGLPGR